MFLASQKLFRRSPISEGTPRGGNAKLKRSIDLKLLFDVFYQVMPIRPKLNRFVRRTSPR